MNDETAVRLLEIVVVILSLGGTPRLEEERHGGYSAGLGFFVAAVNAGQRTRAARDIREEPTLTRFELPDEIRLYTKAPEFNYDKNLGSITLEQVPNLRVYFPRGSDDDEAAEGAASAVSQKCYLHNGYGVVACVFAVRMNEDSRRSDDPPVFSRDNQRDCLNGLFAAVRHHGSCFRYQVFGAYYEWFRLRCDYAYQCNSPRSCRPVHKTRSVPYYRLPGYTLAPFVGLMEDDAGGRRRAALVQRCKRAAVYRAMADMWDCETPPSRNVCHAYRDELEGGRSRGPASKAAKLTVDTAISVVASTASASAVAAATVTEITKRSSGPSLD